MVLEGEKPSNFVGNILEPCIEWEYNNTTNNNINNNTGRYLLSAYYMLNTVLNGLHAPT